jgi:hypothetical protein
MKTFVIITFLLCAGVLTAVNPVETRKLEEPLPQRRILNMERILSGLAIRPALPPFAADTGWHFRDLARQVDSEPNGTWFVWSRDGVRRDFDYRTVLRNAEIVRSGDGYTLKSPTLSPDQWVVDLAAVQKDETAAVRLKRFSDLDNLAAFMKWETKPASATILPERKKTSEFPPFSQPVWDVIWGFQW